MKVRDSSPLLPWPLGPPGQGPSEQSWRPRRTRAPQVRLIVPSWNLAFCGVLWPLVLDIGGCGALRRRVSEGPAGRRHAQTWVLLSWSGWL